MSDLKTIVLDSLPMSSSMVLQPNSTISGLLGGIKAAICNDSSSTILELLQLVDFCRTSTAPDRTTVSKVGLNNTCVKKTARIYMQWILNCMENKLNYYWRLRAWFRMVATFFPSKNEEIPQDHYCQDRGYLCIALPPR